MFLLLGNMWGECRGKRKGAAWGGINFAQKWEIYVGVFQPLSNLRRPRVRYVKTFDSHSAAWGIERRARIGLGRDRSFRKGVTQGKRTDTSDTGSNSGANLPLFLEILPTGISLHGFVLPAKACVRNIRTLLSSQSRHSLPPTRLLCIRSRGIPQRQEEEEEGDRGGRRRQQGATARAHLLPAAADR